MEDLKKVLGLWLFMVAVSLGASFLYLYFAVKIVKAAWGVP